MEEGGCLGVKRTVVLLIQHSQLLCVHQAGLVSDEYAPTVTVTAIAIAKLCSSHPRLRKLRMVFQDLIDLPVEIANLQHLEQLTCGMVLCLGFVDVLLYPT